MKRKSDFQYLIDIGALTPVKDPVLIKKLNEKMFTEMKTDPSKIEISLPTTQPQKKPKEQQSILPFLKKKSKEKEIIVIGDEDDDDVDSDDDFLKTFDGTYLQRKDRPHKDLWVEQHVDHLDWPKKDKEWKTFTKSKKDKDEKRETVFVHGQEIANLSQHENMFIFLEKHDRDGYLIASFIKLNGPALCKEAILKHLKIILKQRVPDSNSASDEEQQLTDEYDEIYYLFDCYKIWIDQIVKYFKYYKLVSFHEIEQSMPEFNNFVQKGCNYIDIFSE
jgi:hypothetical protein